MPRTLPEILAAAAQRFPDRDAVVASPYGAGAGGSPEARTSYGALDAASNRVARALAAEGVRRGDRVALYLHKSAEAIAALYGVMKAGAVYVPLDPFGPPRRQEYILRNCGVRVLATAGDMVAPLAEAFPEGSPLEAILILDGDAPQLPQPLRSARVLGRRDLDALSGAGIAASATDLDLAYILYTSGSTGDPKGVMITHKNALAFVAWAAKRFGIAESDRVSSHAPLHFDLSTFDLYSTHIGGASVHLVPERAATFPIQIARFIASHGISVWYSVPSILVSLVTKTKLAEHDLSALRCILYAGEPFPIKFLRALQDALPRPEVYNLYGPTETNVCTYHKVERAALDSLSAVPIGKAIDGIEVFAVDGEGGIVGPGGTGELLVRGDCVAKGYWGMPQRSAASLVQNPRHADYADPVYRTGDLVRMEPDGSYQFLARIDTMVKVRGYRIELGEIENALLAHAEVREACALTAPDAQEGNRLLACVVLSRPGAADDKAIRAHLASRIPHYMIPEAIGFRDALPKTSTGKIDRALLAREAKGEPAP